MLLSCYDRLQYSDYTVKQPSCMPATGSDSMCTCRPGKWHEALLSLYIAASLNMLMCVLVLDQQAKLAWFWGVVYIYHWRVIKKLAYNYTGLDVLNMKGDKDLFDPDAKSFYTQAAGLPLR